MTINRIQPRPLQPSIPFKGGMASAMPSAGRFLTGFDFQDFGKSSMAQNQVVYALVILSRIVSGAARGIQNGSMNEAREHAFRDILGWTFWFFGNDIAQRLFLRLSGQQFQDTLLKHPTLAKPVGQGFWKRLKWELSLLSPKNPLPTAIQLEQEMAKALQAGKTAAAKLGKALVPEQEKAIEELYHQLIKRRNLASGFGLIVSIALLGVVINLINIYLTRKNVAKKQGGGHA